MNSIIWAIVIILLVIIIWLQWTKVQQKQQELDLAQKSIDQQKNIESEFKKDIATQQKESQQITDAAAVTPPVTNYWVGGAGYPWYAGGLSSAYWPGWTAWGGPLF